MIEIKALRRVVGKNIRLLRKAKGWSQEELAEKADLSYKFIGEIERGSVNPSLDSLIKISNALSSEITRLFRSESHILLTEQDIESVRSSLETLNRVFDI